MNKTMALTQPTTMAFWCRAVLIGLACLLVGSPLSAQAGSDDFMRSTGMIYVAYAVILAIFLGIALFLFRLDRNLNKLEEQIREHEQNR